MLLQELDMMQRAAIYCQQKNPGNITVKRALRFIFISNFTFMGKGAVIRNGVANDKKIFLSCINETFELIQDVQFTNFDFRKFLKLIKLRDKDGVFIYCDPPYLGTENNYSHSFTLSDSIDLFDSLISTGCRFAMSEFNNEFVINQAKDRGLNIIELCKKRNIKNRQIEILITNYNLPYKLF